jgi:cytochrome c oxidase cbb3-type subunit 3
MADFIQGGWSWFIAITTVVSLIGLFVFARINATRRAPGQSGTETSGHVWDEDLQEYNNPLPRWWLNLFYLTVIWGALYLVAYPGLGTFKGLLNWTQQDQYEREMKAADDKYSPLFDRFAATDLDTLAKDPQAVQVGEHLFASRCAACHGSDARGARGFPNLRDDDWLYGGGGDAIQASIAKGRQGVMPPWGPVLGADGVASVTAYVETLSGRPADAALAAKGGEIFKTNCVACHGPDGKGNQMLGAPNLTDDIWLYGGSPERIAETITNGRMGQMPAHEPLLGDKKVHVLAAYVLSLRHSAPAAHVED